MLIWELSTIHVDEKNSPRGRETFPPKFYFVPPWGSFRPSGGI